MKNTALAEESSATSVANTKSVLPPGSPAVMPNPSVTSSEAAQTSHPATYADLLTQLEGILGYRFRDRALLRRALTHRSFANEQPDPRPPHNEALEFLGDAVLEFIISAWLLELFPTQNEGTLSKLRAYAVSAVNLQKHAARHALGGYLLLNRGEEKTGGRHKAALQVDAYEAVIAAIYLDGGIGAAQDFVRREFAHTFAAIDPQNLAMADYKTALQERLQSLGLPTPQYAIVESMGPDHHRTFSVELRVNNQCIATGLGTTIKGAHQAAARTALDNLPAELEKLKQLLPAAPGAGNAPGNALTEPTTKTVTESATVQLITDKAPPQTGLTAAEQPETGSEAPPAPAE